MPSKDEFDVWDWVAFSAMLCISAGIGIFYAIRGRQNETTKEFLMGGRSMHLLPIAISILVSFMSAILILGTPAEMYMAGTEYFLYVFGIMLAVVLAALLFVPLLYPLQLTSSFEVSLLCIVNRLSFNAPSFSHTHTVFSPDSFFPGVES